MSRFRTAGMKARARDPKEPNLHVTAVTWSAISGYTAEAWSYPTKTKREVYVQLLYRDLPVATITVQIPR